MFQFAYGITERVEKLKKLMELKMASLVKPEEMKYWTKALKSVPRMGMSVGGFRQAEREAVVIYIDFSVGQIVSLLLTFK